MATAEFRFDGLEVSLTSEEIIFSSPADGGVTSIALANIEEVRISRVDHPSTVVVAISLCVLTLILGSVAFANRHSSISVFYDAIENLLGLVIVFVVLLVTVFCCCKKMTVVTKSKEAFVVVADLLHFKEISRLESALRSLPVR